MITLYLIDDIRKINDVLNNSCQLALRPTLPDNYSILMTEAGFQAARYAVFTENDPNHKFTSTRKTYALVTLSR